ncbi:MAG: hypothetical protein Kow00106_15080 [Anaerolineae bacterium]
MKSDYGSLRRRTSDAGWQWLLIGLVLGIGFSAVLCMGAYAVGALSFPILEEGTATPQVQVMPNETEVALQNALQQTQQAVTQGALETVPVAPEVSLTPGQPSGESVQTPADETPLFASPTPSPLPGAETGGESTPAPEGGAELARTLATQTPEEASAAMAQDTPVVGTPPVAEESPALGLPQPPAIPPELDAIKTDMARVTGGTFMMGTTVEEATQAMAECAVYGKTCEDFSWVSDSTPPHQTTVDSFDMEIYEVSVAQYVTFLNWKGPNSHKTGCQGQPCVQTMQEQENSYINFDGTTYTARNEILAQHPVIYVTWWGAVEYCNTLNRRLPTEAEWERAARGPQNLIYPWGFEFDGQRAMSSIIQPASTVPVTSYPNGVSPYGIYNMAGNVSEWVYDWYQANYYTEKLNAPEPNPKGPIAGTEKVHRGGSWDTIPLFLRTVHRMSQPPGSPTAAIGFRCVADVVPTAPTAPVGGTGGQTDSGGGAPTLPPPPTQPLPSTAVPTPSGPTPTLAPG